MTDADLKAVWADIWKSLYAWRDERLTTVELEEYLLSFAKQQQAVGVRMVLQEIARQHRGLARHQPAVTSIVGWCEATANELEQGG